MLIIIKSTEKIIYTCLYAFTIFYFYYVHVGMYRILTEFKVFMYWKDPPRANRCAEPRSGEALRFVRAGLSSTWTPKNEVSIRLTQRRVKFSSEEL